jgi:hypothetical protein
MDLKGGRLWYLDVDETGSGSYSVLAAGNSGVELSGSGWNYLLVIAIKTKT